MSTKQNLKSPARRTFFRKAGVGIGIAGAAALGLPGEPAKAAATPGKGFKAGSYRETEHVKKAYQTARF